MTPLLLLGIVIVIPVVIAVALRVNAAILFMSLCVGSVLAQYTTNDTASFASALSPHGNIGSTSVKLILLLLPPLFTVIFMFHSVRGSTKVLLNIIPAISVGLLAVVLIEPLLSVGTRGTLENSNIWHQFLQAQTLIVALSALISLLFLWFQRFGWGTKSVPIELNIIDTAIDFSANIKIM